jgi:thiamine biosynthesis protein ThiS
MIPEYGSSGSGKNSGPAHRGGAVQGMKITVNGFEMEVSHGTMLQTLLDILEETVRPDIIVEINRKFVHVKDYDGTFLSEGDRVEIIYLDMGG